MTNEAETTTKGTFSAPIVAELCPQPSLPEQDNPTTEPIEDSPHDEQQAKTRTSTAEESVRATIPSVEESQREAEAGRKKEERTRGLPSSPRNIHWVTPCAALLLFIVGLGAAIGHCIFFSKIKGKSVGDQIWTQRYSLALAFVFKSALASALSLTLAQYAWLSLRRSKAGTPIETIDAMFLSGSSLLSFLSAPLWRAAAGTGLMAACIWLMPFTALVAPTALTVGFSVIHSTDESCTVSTVDFGVGRNFTKSTQSRALFVTDNSDLYIHPSTSSERLTAAVVQGGRQLGWSSPCGSNCSYDLAFFGPSWQCSQNEDVDDPRAPWKAQLGGSYWYWGEYGDGSNITVTPEDTNNLLYSPVYYAGLNASTNQFWAGFAAGFTRGLDPSVGLMGSSLRDILEVQAYSCQVANTSYHIHISYENGQQINNILKTEASSIFPISAPGWEGQGSYSNPVTDLHETLPIALQDLVGMYTPMMDMLSGYIDRDPRYELVANTSLGTVPSLITNLPIYVTYASETPYIPRRNLGSLLQDLSYNLTISLMSDPSLLVTGTTTVACTKSRTEAVWEVHWPPIIAAYSAGLGVTLVCLVVGTYALVANGVSYDTSFSSILRTTRNAELDVLAEKSDIGGLPLSQAVGKQRLHFLSGTGCDADGGDITRLRNGFVRE